MELDEAKRIVAEHECGAHGHDFEHIVDRLGNPLRIGCDRCHRSWNVEQKETDRG